MDMQTHVIEPNGLNAGQTVEKLQAKIRTLETVIDDLQAEVKAHGQLKDGGVLPKDNEPFFVLVARDPFAPILVDAWAFLRMGRFTEAQHVLNRLLNPTLVVDPQMSDDPQIINAFRIGRYMADWFKAKILNGAG
ncbi:MAG: hypothetical protein L3J65_01025 [Robiginitomaculum sp.]|nr:hypothetical protein [Robiginitomaculum sp.]